MITDIVSWPAIVAATTPPAPSVRTVTSELATKTAPMKPPRKYHHGTWRRSPTWLPPAASATTNSAIVPTVKDTVAAAKVPIALPSFELIGGCIATSIPANAESSSAIPFVTWPPSSSRPRPRPRRAAGRARRGRPLLARRVEPVGPGPLARDDLPRLLDLGVGRLEQQLVVDLEHERRGQAGVAQGVARADHRHLDDVRRAALDRGVHRQPLAQRACLPLARAELGDAPLAPEERGHVALLGGALDRRVDVLLDLREAR